MANYKPNKAISTRYHGFNFRMLIAYDLRPPAGDPNIRAGHIRGFIRQQPDNRLVLRLQHLSHNLAREAATLLDRQTSQTL